MKAINRFNDWLAVRVTNIFGSMWTAYLFFLYGFGPVLWPQYMNAMLYWSNTVQLWSLPVIMVGGIVLGRASEKRSEVMLKLIQDLHNEEQAHADRRHKEHMDALKQTKEIKK